MQLTTQWKEISSDSFYSSHFTIKLEGKYTTQSTTENYTDTQFRVKNYADSGYKWRTDKGTVGFRGAYSNEKSTPLYPTYVEDGDVLITLSKRIYHNDDGSMSINLGAFLETTIGSSYPAKTNVVLPKIDRVSTISIPNSSFDIGDIVPITINQYVSSYHQDLYIVLGGNEVSIQSGATGTIQLDTGLLANQIYQLIPNASEYNSNFKLYTYDINNNLIGSSTFSFSAKVVDAKPTFDVAYQDTNATTLAITNNNQQIIQNKSTLQINITNATALKYATLSSVKVDINGTITTTSIDSSTKNIDIGVLNLSGNTNATITLTDSRGLSTDKVIELTILEWKPPTANITLGRQQNFYTATNITVDATYSSLDNKNTIVIQYRTKKTSDANYGAWNNLSDNVLTTFNADNQYAWDIQVKVQDALETTPYNNLNIGVGIPIFFIDRFLRSIGLNCFPTRNNSVEVNGVDISNQHSLQDEIPIGIFNDGRLIYRKDIWLSSLPNNTTQTYDFADYNIVPTLIVDIKGMAYASNGGQFPLNGTRQNATAQFCLWGQITNSVKNFSIYVGTDRADCEALITVEYLKD